MCGRYTLEFDNDFFKRFKTTNKIDFKPRYNVAPSYDMPVIVSHSPNTVEIMKWGLIPFWEEKKEKPHGLINVRDDTLIQKAWGHKYLQHQRCLVPSTGFFEWKRTTDGKIPYYFHLTDRKYFSFAGMYSTYTQPSSGRELKTYTIITTSPNAVMEHVHNRMPVILKEEDEDAWLNPDTVEIDQLQNFLKPYAARSMSAYSVSKKVNSPAYDRADIIQELKGELNSA